MKKRTEKHIEERNAHNILILRYDNMKIDGKAELTFPSIFVW